MESRKRGATIFAPNELSAIRAALPFYREANRHILSPATGRYYGKTVDDVLAEWGILFANDPVRWCVVCAEVQRRSGVLPGHRKYGANPRAEESAA